MLDAVLILALLPLLVAAHEAGHLLAGRVVGVPGEAMRIVLHRFPPHVALRSDEGGWVAPPDAERYRKAFERHVPSERAALAYIAGGFLVGAVAVLVVAALAPALGRPVVGLRVAQILTIFTLIYVLVDAVATRWRGVPSGDASSMWIISPAACMVTLLATLGLFAAALALA